MTNPNRICEGCGWKLSECVCDPPKEEVTMRYRKKPVDVEARQVPIPFDHDITCDILGWINDNGGVAGPVGEEAEPYVGYIATLEGDMMFQPGDWVIQGIAGEFYPCKDDIFQGSYEPVTV